MRIMRNMHENKPRVTQPQIIQIATALDARIAAMRAGGMSATAIRRALGLSEAAALASGLSTPKTVTEASGGAARGGAQGGAATRAGSQCVGFCCTPDIIEVRDASARACGLCPETLSGRDQGQSAVRGLTRSPAWPALRAYGTDIGAAHG